MRTLTLFFVLATLGLEGNMLEGSIPSELSALESLGKFSSHSIMIRASVSIQETLTKY